MKKSLFTTILIVIVCNCSFGQLKYPQQSVAVGGTIGFGKYNKNFQNARAYGFKADWQYNLAEWFSLRAEIGYTQNTWLTYSADGGWTVYDSIQFNFQPSVFFGGVSPLLYSRGKHFSFFAGASIAVGAVTMALTENRFTSDPMNNINESFIENPKFKSTAFGLNPIIGFNIPLKKSRLPYGEIEISGAMNRWLKPFFTEARSFRPTDYRYFHLQLAYRYNFK